MNYKVCSKCQFEKEHSEEHFRGSRSDCRECENFQRRLRENLRGHLPYARAAKRRAAKLQAMPKWADLEKIKQIYKDAKALSNFFEGGFATVCHVDHYYPLQGKKVCGLHNEFNLRVITWIDNIKKSNKHPDEFYQTQVY